MTNRIITFHLLFAAQFAVIVSGMFVNTKTGLASMAVILMFTTICLIQLANDKQTNWKPGQNIMTYMCIVWLVYYLLEVLNPNNVMEAWNIGITPYALIPLICAFIVPIVIRTKKDIELLLIVWSIFVLIFTIKVIGRRTTVSVIKTCTSCMRWEDGVLISSGPVYVTSHASLMQLIMECTLRYQQ